MNQPINRINLTKTDCHQPYFLPSTVTKKVVSEHGAGWVGMFPGFSIVFFPSTNRRKAYLTLRNFEANTMVDRVDGLMGNQRLIGLTG